jgi:hypothetical protein
VRGVAIGERVVDPDPQQGLCQAGVGNHFGNHASQAAGHEVLFHGCDALVVFHEFDQCIRRGRIEHAEVDQAKIESAVESAVESAIEQLLDCVVRPGDHAAGGDDQPVPALSHGSWLSDRRRIVLIVEFPRHVVGNAEIDAAVYLEGVFHDFLQFLLAGGSHHCNTWNGPHQGYVFQRNVGGALISRGKAGKQSRDLDVMPLHGDRRAYLLERSHGDERGQWRMDHRHLAHGRHPGRGAHHVLLGNAEIVPPVRKILRDGAKRLSSFTSQDNHFWPSLDNRIQDIRINHRRLPA